MDKETRSWLVGVPFGTDGKTTPHERPVLSRRQKRELASLTGVVMASTVFFLTPLLVSAPAAPELESQLAQDLATPGETPFVSITNAGTASLPVPALVRTVSATSLSPAPVAFRRNVSAVRRPVAATVALNAVPTSVPSKESARGRRKSISSGLLRVLVGSGRHRVQPFPTPASTD